MKKAKYLLLLLILANLGLVSFLFWPSISALTSLLPGGRLAVKSEYPEYRLVLADFQGLANYLQEIDFYQKSAAYTGGKVGRSLLLVLTPEVQPDLRIQNKDGQLFQSAGLSYNAFLSRSTLKFFYLESVIKEILSLPSGETIVNQNILADLCLFTRAHFDEVNRDDCYELARKFLAKNQKPVFKLIIRQKKGLFGFGVKEAWAACQGSYACGQNVTTCSCSDGSSAFCDSSREGRPCGWDGTCECSTDCKEAVLKPCSNLIQSTCTSCPCGGGSHCCDFNGCSWQSDCVPNCSCAADTCQGSTCSNGCGGSCNGTKVCPATCQYNYWDSCDSNGVKHCRTQTVTSTCDPVTSCSCYSNACPDGSTTTEGCCVKNAPSAVTCSDTATVNGVAESSSAVVSALVSWSGPTSWGTGCPDNKSFKIYEPLGTLEKTITELATQSTDIEVTGGGNHSWEVRAVNNTVYSSDTCSFCVLQNPKSFICHSGNPPIGIQEYTLEWDAFADNNTDWGYGCPDNKNFGVYYYYSEDGQLDTHGNPVDYASPIIKDSSVNTHSLSGLDYGTYFWQVRAVNDGDRLDAVDNFRDTQVCAFVVKEPTPWWQTTDGDVHAQGAITSLIPGCATTEKYLSLTGPGGFPGVVSWGGGDAPSLGDGAVSTPSFNWQANDLNRRPKVGFEYLANRLNLDKSKVFSGDLSATADGTYYVDATSGAYSLNGAALGTSKIVLFVEGDVKVLSSITVSPGGFFALVSKGRITFDASMAQTDGFYLADGVIDTSFAKTAFKGYGSFIAWGGFVFRRDLGEESANCTPSESFYARPDLYINAPEEFLLTPSFFQEMAP